MKERSIYIESVQRFDGVAGTVKLIDKLITTLELCCEKLSITVIPRYWKMSELQGGTVCNAPLIFIEQGCVFVFSLICFLAC